MGRRGPTPGHQTIRPLPGREERRPPPPEGMTEAQTKLWRDVVETEPASLFDSAARRHLLRLYCEHATFRADLQGLIDKTPVEAVADPEKASAFEAMLRLRDRETKALVSLATRLRLTNQARFTAQAAATEARNMASGTKPWDDPDPAAEYFGDA